MSRSGPSPPARRRSRAAPRAATGRWTTAAASPSSPRRMPATPSRTGPKAACRSAPRRATPSPRRRIARWSRTSPPSRPTPSAPAPLRSAGGTTTGDGSYSSGASATVTATANAGYVFIKWTVGGTQVSTSPSYTFTVTANRALVANFVVAGTQQTITTSASPVAGGTTSGGGNYVTGDSATVVATANPCYKFSKWQEGGTTVSTSASYTFTVAGNRTLVAKFNEAFVITATLVARCRRHDGNGQPDLQDRRQREGEGVPGGGLQLRQLDGERRRRQHGCDLLLQRHRQPHARGELPLEHRRHHHHQFRARRRRHHDGRRRVCRRRQRHGLGPAERGLRLCELDGRRRGREHDRGLHLHGGDESRAGGELRPGHHHHRERLPGLGRHDPGRGRLRQRRERDARSGGEPGLPLHELDRGRRDGEHLAALHVQRHRARARSWRTSRPPTPSRPRRGPSAAAPCSARAR